MTDKVQGANAFKSKSPKDMKDVKIPLAVN